MDIRSRAFCRWLAASPKKRGVGWIVALSLMALSVRLITLQGWIRPIRIAGGSMADSLLGPHFEVRCLDCGGVFRCGVEFPPRDELAVCPNCGYSENPVDGDGVTPGQRVLIDRWQRLFRTTSVWQVVAFRSPQDHRRLEVKRMVARGAGSVSIRDGDVFVDGRIQRKSLEQLRAVRILVHDDQFRPAVDSALSPRWKPDQPSSGWKPTPDGYAHSCMSSLPSQPRPPSKKLDWLEYHQWTCWPNPSPPVARQADNRILDHYGYNQSVSRGQLHEVPDMMLACRLTAESEGRIVFQFALRDSRFTVELNLGTREQLFFRDDVLMQSRRLRLATPPWHIEMASCDQQILAAINGETTLRYSYQPSSHSSKAGRPAIRIGTADCQVGLAGIRIYRDIHYLGPGGVSSWTSDQRLTTDQWFALGDNVPVSIDSRHRGGIALDAIVGPVVETRW